MNEPQVVGDLLDDMKNSYDLYKQKGVFEDVEFLKGLLEESLGLKLKVQTDVSSLYESNYKREIKKQADAYYTVYVCFDGFSDKFELLRIPYLDDTGVFNVHGERRVLTMRLSPSPGISYSEKNASLQVALPSRSISFELKPKYVRVKYGNNMININRLLKAMLIKNGIDLNLTDYFSSAYIIRNIHEIDGMTNNTITDYITKFKILDEYASDNYALGNTRDVLNRTLTLDRAVDMTLNRPVLNYTEGTRITHAMIKELKKNLVNEVYVKAVPRIAGYIAQKTILGDIRKGTKNSLCLQQILADNDMTVYSDYDYIPEDIKGGFILNAGVKLDNAFIETLADIGLKSIKCSTGSTTPAHEYRFEQEIIGNYTCRLGDVVGLDLPKGRFADEYVYYYNNPNLDAVPQDKLTVHDMLALTSLMGHIHEHPEENPLRDKDDGFLKRVESVNEIFSRAFRETAATFVKKYNRKIKESFFHRQVSYDVFKAFTIDWIKYMWVENYISVADTINPLATLSQVHQIKASVRKEPSDEMRKVSMAHYGRICPYETPAGPKLGLTTTKALGAKLRNGLLETPYQKVLKNSSGDVVGLSETITWMTPDMESNFCIGDRFDLINTGKRVPARIKGANNKIVVEMVKLSRLDYVNAFAEQHLSLSASMIPFASCDESARVSMASGMMKQSILLQGSEIPRVYTSTYKKCFENSNMYVVRAKKDGVIDSMPTGKINVTYDDGTQEDIPVAETNVTAKSVNFLNFKVGIGDKFKAGDILADSAVARNGIYSPGVNLFVAYIPDGWSYEDAVVTSESAAIKLTSITATDVEHRVGRTSGYSISAGRENYNRYIPEDGIITYARRVKRDDQRRQEKEPIIARKTGGLLYNIERIEENKSKVKYKCQLLSFNRLQVGDKIIGRHSNKGVTSTIRKDSQMPVFTNGTPIELLFNPLGVPSRMNVGQNFEAYLGFVATLLDITIQSNAFNGASKEEVQLLMNYVYELANTSNADVVCAKYPMIPAEVHSHAKNRHNEIREWEGSFYPDGTARLWNPNTGKFYENPVAFGVAYILKLEHEVGNKIHVRAGMLEEEYTVISKQPTAGASKGGGQKMGEMELVAIAAHGANDFLEETLNSMSDNVQARENMTLESIGMSDKRVPGKSYPESVNQFMYLLEAAGIKMIGTEEELPDVSYENSKNKTISDIKNLITVSRRKENDMRKRLRK
jgi:DNA-directed RNA polymerase beta subunit